MAIRQLTPPQNLGLQPSEIGVEATAAAARRGGAFYNQAAQDISTLGHEVGSTIKDAGQAALEYENHREISAGQKDLAARINNLTNQWNDTAKNADPNDTSVAAKFREEVLEPELESFAGNFHTQAAQQWAQTHVGQLRQHMFEKTSADMATLAGQAARVNLTQTVNFLSNTAMNDPSSLDFALSTLQGSTDALIDSSPNLKGTAAAGLKAELSEKGREQIVKAAALGYINKTAQVPPWASDPKYSKYINGIELRQFQKAAEAQNKANLYYDRQAEVLAKQRADLQVHKNAGELMANGVTVDPNNPNRLLISPDFMQHALDIARKNPDAPSAAATVRTLVDWAEGQNRQRAEAVISDPATKSGLIAGLADPNNPTDELKVLRAAADNKLSTRDTTLLREMVHTMGPEISKDPLLHATLDAVGERVGKTLVGDGHERYSQALQAFLPEYLRRKRAGTLEPNALDLSDPNSLIRQSIKAYEPPPAERMQMHILKTIGAGAGGLGGGLGGDTAPASTAFVPPSNWQWNPARRQYRDPDGKLYDARGHPLPSAIVPQSR